jgi:voltage-dependent anion channel protein 2
VSVVIIYSCLNREGDLRQLILSKLFRTNKGILLRASYAHYFDHEKVAEAAVVSRMLSEKENVLVVGGTWIMDDKTTVKARFDSRGKLVTLLHHKIKPKTCIKISSEFDPKALDRIPIIRYGLSLSKSERFPFSVVWSS